MRLPALACRIRASGSATLGETLVSHGVTSQAGTPVRSDLRLNSGALGVGWRFEFRELRLSVTPKLDAALFDFSYRLNSATGTASRAYNDSAVRLGAEASWKLADAFAIELEGASSLPISHMVQLANMMGRVAWRLPLPGPVRVNGFLGTGIRWIDFEDTQPVPNHTKIRSGALLDFGFSIAY